MGGKVAATYHPHAGPTEVDRITGLAVLVGLDLTYRDAWSLCTCTDGAHGDDDAIVRSVWGDGLPTFSRMVFPDLERAERERADTPGSHPIHKQERVVSGPWTEVPRG